MVIFKLISCSENEAYPSLSETLELNLNVLKPYVNTLLVHLALKGEHPDLSCVCLCWCTGYFS